MKAHSPKFSLTGILNALFLVVSDVLQSRSGSAFPPLSPKLHSPVRKKGGWAVGLALCQAQWFGKSVQNLRMSFRPQM